jgi:hypothetical protein
MKRKLLAIVIIFFCTIALPVSVLADSRTYTPPPRKGVIFVVVRLKGYSSRDFRRSTQVSIKWGSYYRSKRFPGVTSIRPIVGVVIRLRHDNNDSVPLTVETDGQIVQIEQTSRPPSQWTDSSWEQTDW